MGYEMKVCIVGLGLMGSALARRLSSNGFGIVLYNRTKEKALSLANEIGGVVADTPAICCDSSDITAIFVADDSALLNVALPPNGFIEKCRDRYIVNMSTVTTSISSILNDVVKIYGGRYIEAPVYGSFSEVLEGKLTVMVSSDSAIDGDIEMFLNSIARKVIYVGKVPKAMALKLALNQLNMSVVASLAESLAFLHIFNIDYNIFIELVKGTWMEPLVTRFLERSLKEHPPRFRIELAAKDLQSFIESARTLKLNTLITSAAMQRYLEATLHGYGDKDYPNIAKYLIDTIDKQKQ
jgi:3-hydroxyisobutyrate dehydrogenase